MQVKKVIPMSLYIQPYVLLSFCLELKRNESSLHQLVDDNVT